MEKPPNTRRPAEPGDPQDPGTRPGPDPRPAPAGERESSPTPAPAPGGPGLVRLAGWFYGVLLAVAVVWGVVAGRSLFYAAPDMGQVRLDVGRDLLAGLLAAAVVILISDRITRMTRWGDALARELAAVLGRLSVRQCIALAAMSGVAEEAFFRGALQPSLGLVGASLLFGLAHFVPRRALLPWTGFSIAAGFLLGILYDATGNLLAPVVAHGVINAVNLRVVTRRYGGGAGRG